MLAVLLAVSFAHLLNDTIQAIIPAIYPLLKESFQLTFGQVGLITLTFQLTASILSRLLGSTQTIGRCPLRWPQAWE